MHDKFCVYIPITIRRGKEKNENLLRNNCDAADTINKSRSHRSLRCALFHQEDATLQSSDKFHCYKV